MAAQNPPDDPLAFDSELDLDTTTQEILLAATNHDLPALRRLLKTGSANVKDADTGISPLHAAILSCEEDNEPTGDASAMAEDAGGAISTQALQEKDAVETIRLLFEYGAIWNDLDNANETPGCAALRLGLKDAYGLIVEAGVRAELLLMRLDDFELLAGDDDEGDEDDEDGDLMNVEAINGHENGTAEVEDGFVTVEAADADMAEGVPQLTRTDENGAVADVDVTSARYLASELSFGGDRLVDADDNGVMMAWETDLMKQSAEALIDGPGKRVLNVGHGMGIVDGIFQETSPAEHHIIEAHPAVLERMAKDGWMDKPGVVVHQGRWQDRVKDLIDQGVTFDAIYFDTFAEDYSDLRDFFTNHVIALMDQNGRFGFFNGLGADRQVCYDVYTRIVEMDLFEAGMDTRWRDIAIADLDQDGEWTGIRRKYWALPTYRLPTCTFVG